MRTTNRAEEPRVPGRRRAARGFWPLVLGAALLIAAAAGASGCTASVGTPAYDYAYAYPYATGGVVVRPGVRYYRPYPYRAYYRRYPYAYRRYPGRYYRRY